MEFFYTLYAFYAIYGFYAFYGLLQSKKLSHPGAIDLKAFSLLLYLRIEQGSNDKSASHDKHFVINPLPRR